MGFFHSKSHGKVYHSDKPHGTGEITHAERKNLPMSEKQEMLRMRLAEKHMANAEMKEMKKQGYTPDFQPAFYEQQMKKAGFPNRIITRHQMDADDDPVLGKIEDEKFEKKVGHIIELANRGDSRAYHNESEGMQKYIRNRRDLEKFKDEIKHSNLDPTKKAIIMNTAQSRYNRGQDWRKSHD